MIIPHPVFHHVPAGRIGHFAQVELYLGVGAVHRSCALHELKRTAEARDNLLCVVNRFERDHVIYYNLACYECQLGRLEQAMQWLEMAFLLGGMRRMKLAALDDPDLEPLWDDVCQT